MPPTDAVRVEEMVNGFPYDLPQPKGDAPFAPTVSVMQTPWNPTTRLVAIALQGRAVTKGPPLNLVFLIDTPDDLKRFIAAKRQLGTYLSVLGFGRGHLDDTTMQALAQNGNGTASSIGTLSKAQKVLGDQLTGALLPIANDVKVQIEWNPAQVCRSPRSMRLRLPAALPF